MDRGGKRSPWTMPEPHADNGGFPVSWAVGVGTAGVAALFVALVGFTLFLRRWRTTKTPELYEDLAAGETGGPQGSSSKRPSRCSQHSIYGCITQNTPIDFVVPGLVSPQPPPGGTPPDTAQCSPSGSSLDLPLWARLALIDNESPLLGGLNPELYKDEPSESGDEVEFPDGHIGRVWVRLCYEPASERLAVTLVKARNLPSRTLGSNNSCDPFVRLWLLPDERRYLQSKVKKKTCNPTFDEIHLFQVSARSVRERYLKLTVLDNERGRRHNVLGHVALGLGDVAEGGSATVWRDLERDAELGAPDRRSPGEILLSLCYNAGLERLTVTVCEARSLEPDSGFDSLVKLCFMRGNKVVKTKKTAVARLETKYNESFHFRLPPGEVNSASVVLQVTKVDAGNKAKEQCLGRVVLGSFMFTRGKALEHWNQAMAANHRQVRLWHQLT